MKHYLSICWCILCLFACGVSSKNSELLIIPVDVAQNSPVRLSELSDDIKKIELETSDECVIGRIGQVLCDDDRIFILDMGAGRSLIHAFDLSGKFLFAINRRGRGPGEYIYINAMAFDEVNKHLYITSQGKILKYDRNGNFIDERSRVDFMEYIRFENDFLHVFTQEFTRPMGNNTVANIAIMMRYSRDWQPVDTMVVKTMIVPGIVGATGTNVDFVSKDNRGNLFVYYPICLYEPFVRDTLYMLDKNRLIPYAKLKFSDENPSKRNKNIYSISHTSHLLIAEYVSFSEKGKKYFCYDFRSKTGKNMTGGFLDDVYDTGLTEIRLLNSRYFYFVKEAEYAPDIELEPNPALYIGKFKNK